MKFLSEGGRRQLDTSDDDSGGIDWTKVLSTIPGDLTGAASIINATKGNASVTPTPIYATTPVPTSTKSFVYIGVAVAIILALIYFINKK